MRARANYLQAEVASYSTNGPIKLRFLEERQVEDRVVTLAKIMRPQTDTTTISKNQSRLIGAKARSKILSNQSCLKMSAHISRKR